MYILNIHVVTCIFNIPLKACLHVLHYLQFIQLLVSCGFYISHFTWRTSVLRTRELVKVEFM